MSSESRRMSDRRSLKGSLIPVALGIAVLYLSQECHMSSLFRLYPYMLLLTKYREENVRAWEKYAQVNTAVIYPPRPIPEISASGGHLSRGWISLFILIIFIQTILWRTCARPRTTLGVQQWSGACDMEIFHLVIALLVAPQRTIRELYCCPEMEFARLSPGVFRRLCHSCGPRWNRWNSPG